METIPLTIDGKKITCSAGTSILDAAEKNGINIPRLCHHPKLGRRAAHLPASETAIRLAAPSDGQARAPRPGPADTGGSLLISYQGA